MVLEDILEITSESITVNVVDYDSGNIISYYDGKNSIDSELNQRKVIMQYVQNNELYIIIL